MGLKTSCFQLHVLFNWHQSNCSLVEGGSTFHILLLLLLLLPVLLLLFPVLLLPLPVLLLPFSIVPLESIPDRLVYVCTAYDGRSDGSLAMSSTPFEDGIHAL